MVWLTIGCVFVFLVACLSVLLVMGIRFKRDVTVFYDNVKARQEAIERQLDKLKDWKQSIEDILGVRIAWESRVEQQLGVRFEWESTVDKTLGIKSEWERRKDLFRKLFERYREE